MNRLLLRTGKRRTFMIGTAAVFMPGLVARRANDTDRSNICFSKHTGQDVGPDTSPSSGFWRDAPAIIADQDPFGNIVAGHRTQVHSKWTPNNLYFLFICSYEALYLKPQPRKDLETNQLWNWDVAEVFLGADAQNIHRYREFEVSPQGEWIDLDIDLNKPHHEDGWLWNSRFEVAARIDESAKTWYACMRIPYSSVDAKAAAPGNVLRVNFFRAQGPPGNRKEITWQPTHQPTFHVPEAFGTLKLIE
jgi:hypothetical protein